MQNQLDFTTENYNKLLKEAFRASIEYDQLTGETKYRA